MAPLPPYDLSLDELSVALSYVSGGAVPVPVKKEAPKKKEEKKEEKKEKKAAKKVRSWLSSVRVWSSCTVLYDYCMHHDEKKSLTNYRSLCVGRRRG
jgi:hypothetical protein